MRPCCKREFGLGGAPRGYRGCSACSSFGRADAAPLVRDKDSGGIRPPWLERHARF
jgi:hypothetical protein